MKVAFTSIAIFVITEDGQLLMGNNKQYEFYKGQPVVELLANRKVVDVAATGNEVAILTADNQRALSPILRVKRWLAFLPAPVILAC